MGSFLFLTFFTQPGFSVCLCLRSTLYGCCAHVFKQKEGKTKHQKAAYSCFFIVIGAIVAVVVWWCWYYCVVKQTGDTYYEKKRRTTKISECYIYVCLSNVCIRLKYAAAGMWYTPNDKHWICFFSLLSDGWLFGIDAWICCCLNVRSCKVYVLSTLFAISFFFVLYSLRPTAFNPIDRLCMLGFRFNFLAQNTIDRVFVFGVKQLTTKTNTRGREHTQHKKKNVSFGEMLLVFDVLWGFSYFWRRRVQLQQTFCCNLECFVGKVCWKYLEKTTNCIYISFSCQE